MRGTVYAGGSAAYALGQHIADKANPHGVTADQVMMVNDDGTTSNLQSVVRQMKDYVDEQASISKAIETTPTQYGTLTYTGEAQTVTLNGFDGSKMVMLSQSVQSATNAGTYKILIQPKPGFYWADNGRNEIREVTWTIQPQALTSEPELSSTAADLVYTGSEITPTWTGLNASIMTCAGDVSGTNAGPYAMVVTLDANYCWTDGTTGARSFPWAITPMLVGAVPTQSGTLTYNGGAQSPTWTGFDSSIMTATGTQTASGAGGYTVTFTLAENYGWPDGTTGPKDAVWTIAKAACAASISKGSMSLVTGALSDTMAVTRTGDGVITATSSNSAVASVAVSGSTVTVTGRAKGAATITVRVAEGTNHLAASNMTCAVTVTIFSTNPADNTPSDIQAAARSGRASSIWKVGDAFPIQLSGTVAGQSLSGTYRAFILGFDHNASVEGGSSIHFMIGKDASGKDIAFCDSHYNSNQTSGFVMNTTNVNSGGWNSSYMKKTVMPAFKNAMEASWRNVVSGCSKWTDNGTGNHTTAAEVTPASEQLFLLSAFEVFGSDSYSNPAEKNHQKQYAYFANGNSKVAYRHDQTGTAVRSWLRSSGSGSAYTFCYVSTNGAASGNNAYYSFGLRPAFKVA